MRWDREKLPTPNSHVYGENGVEIMVYNMKRHSKMRGTKEKTKKKERLKKYNSKKEKLKTIDHTTRV